MNGLRQDYDTTPCVDAGEHQLRQRHSRKDCPVQEPRVKIEIGYNRRHWVTFAIKNPTPEELETLNGEDEEQALELCRELDKADRLDLVSDSEEDVPEYFAEHSEPAIIGNGTSQDGDED